MATSPLISVIMPAFNAQATIGASISGVLTQTHPNVELIVVDDGSTDRTRAICEGYGELVRYLRVENGGTATARNHGLCHARGEFVALCDSDDVLLPPYLEVSLRAWHRAGGGRRLVTNDAILLTDAGVAHGRHLVGKSFPRAGHQRMATLQKNFVSILTLFPRSLIEEVGPFDETLRYREDWELWMRAILRGWEAVYQPLPHALYRWTPNAKTTHSAGYDAEDEILRRVADRLDDTLSPQEKRFLHLRLRTSAPRLLLLQAEQSLREGDLRTSRARFAAVAALTSEDWRIRFRSTAIAQIPGVAILWRQRLLRIDRALGRAPRGTRR